MGKRLVVIKVSCVLLVAVAMIMTVYAGGHNKAAKPKPSAKKDVTKNIGDTICQATDLKHPSCGKGSENAQPKELILAAIKAAMEQVNIAKKNTGTLEKHYIHPRTSQSFMVCDDSMESATMDLQSTFDKINSLDWSKVGEYANDIQTALGSSHSAFTMCMDSFEDDSATTAEAKKEMEKVIRLPKQFIDKALAMASEIKST